MLTAIEAAGTIDTNHRIVLDEALPIGEKSRVRVIILFEESSQDFNENEWLKVASQNAAFDFLNDEDENIYTLEDGKPLADEK